MHRLYETAVPNSSETKGRKQIEGKGTVTTRHEGTEETRDIDLLFL
jgi:hypothetical protein